MVHAWVRRLAVAGEPGSNQSFVMDVRAHIVRWRRQADEIPHASLGSTFHHPNFACRPLTPPSSWLE